MNFVIYIPDGRNTKLQDASHIESTMKTPQGKDCYTVYITIHKMPMISTNSCKERLKIFTIVKGLALEINLFTGTEPIDLDRLHKFLSEVISRKQSEPRRQPPMDLDDRTN